MAETFSMDIFVTPQPTNNTEPTGGVIEPKHMLKISTTPKCTGSIPMLTQIGRKIGVKIKMAGVMSRNIPMISKITLMSSRITYGLSEMVSKPLAIAPGMPE